MPCVWNVSIVFSPHACPFLRSASVQTTGCQSGARLMLAPDWQPVVWTETERKKGQAWGLKTIETFHTHGTPTMEHYTGPTHPKK